MLFMVKPEQTHPSNLSTAADLVEFLTLEAWIPSAHARWLPVIKALLEAFLQRFDSALLAQLLDHQHTLPPTAPAAVRAAGMARELTALHKICQMLARNPRLPAEARAALAPLESLPPEAIPDSSVQEAIALVREMRPDLELDPQNPRVARGSVADVFRLRHRTSEGTVMAFKTVRADAMLRIQNEAAVLMEMVHDAPAVGALAGPNFAAALGEALRDAATALLREIDFAGEAANLQEARAFYKSNRRIRVPAPVGVPLDRGIYMEFVEAAPLFEAPLDAESRRDAARLVFRRLLLDPLFSGLSESIFHADPHAGNLMVQTQKHRPLTLVLLDWSQAGRLSASLRHALIELCLYCFTGEEPSPDLLMRLLESNQTEIRISLPAGDDPLEVAFEIVQQLALQGHPVPLDLLLMRKSFMTLDGITRQLDPDFNPWQETLAYGSEMFASEAVFRGWSLPFPWLDRTDFYRSGLSNRALAVHLTRTIPKFCATAQNLLAHFRNPWDVHLEA